MNSLKNILFLISAFLIGSVANMLVVILGGILIPLPAGADVSSPEALKASIHLMQPVNFITPFVAHAAGTLVGAYLIGRWALARNLQFAMIIAITFFAGGLYMVIDLPAPIWFEALDLLIAYFPMGYLGYRLAKKQQ